MFATLVQTLTLNQEKTNITYICYDFLSMQLHLIPKHFKGELWYLGVGKIYNII